MLKSFPPEAEVYNNTLWLIEEHALQSRIQAIIFVFLPSWHWLIGCGFRSKWSDFKKKKKKKDKAERLLHHFVLLPWLYIKPLQTEEFPSVERKAGNWLGSTYFLLYIKIPLPGNDLQFCLLIPNRKSNNSPFPFNLWCPKSKYCLAQCIITDIH